MPFRLSIDLIKNLVIIIDSEIKKEHNINKKVRLENDIYYDNLIKLNDRILFINSKLKSFQELSPTTEEISDLKFRCEELHNKLHNIREILGPIIEKHEIIIKKRDEHYKKWYACLFCINRYKKINFIEDLQELNKKILNHIDLLNTEFNNLTNLMADYEKQIMNLKFKFLPLRRLWISNKWDIDANQTSQRVTIFTFSQEIQSKDCKDSKYTIHSIHYENMNKFLNNMIIADKTGKQLEAIGLGRSCGTYFLDSSLIASLTNTPSEKLEWTTLSDMALYFSLLPMNRPTDDKITPDIITRYNEEKKILEQYDKNEDYNKYLQDNHSRKQRNMLAYMKELQERQETDYRSLLKQLKLKPSLSTDNLSTTIEINTNKTDGASFVQSIAKMVVEPLAGMVKPVEITCEVDKTISSTPIQLNTEQVVESSAEIVIEIPQAPVAEIVIKIPHAPVADNGIEIPQDSVADNGIEIPQEPVAEIAIEIPQEPVAEIAIETIMNTIVKMVPGPISNPIVKSAVEQNIPNKKKYKKRNKKLHN